jgi:poly(U)-specific endoribonuclease
MDIYQRIWDADQQASGVPALLPGQMVDASRGGVTVVASSSGVADLKAHKVLTDVLIPVGKMQTYDRTKRLFDNYALDEQDPEVETPEERQEVHDLLDAVIDTPAMQVARTYVQEATSTTVSRDRWYATLLEMWFRTFSQGGDPALSGFEHVFVGEQEGSKVQGYHFWYKYYLDDGLASTIDAARLPGFKDDRIVYVRGLYENGQEQFPESVTVSYRWDAPDYDRNALRPLTKPKGGFFVGCSVEGLMALGAVRAHVGARAPKEAVINGGRYDLKLFRSQNNQHIRTFYPVFLGPAGDQPQPTPQPQPGPSPVGPTPIVASDIRILSALVNPVGDDPGKETVTLLNTGSASASLEGWFLVDKMGNRFAVNDIVLASGVAQTVLLPKHSIQLSNKGGEIRLVNRDGHTAHIVSYSKAQAQDEGRTIVF